MGTTPSALRGRRALVVGLQFGDEGKGQLVDVLAGDHDVIVRFNGGANAGHSVRIGDERFALHLLPCGVLTEGTLNLLGNGVLVDPGVFLAEIDELRARGFDVSDRVRVSERAHLVLEHHRQEDRLRGAAQRALLGEAGFLGTTGRGIGPAVADKAHRDVAVRIADLGDRRRLRRKLEAVVRWKNAELATLARLAGEAFEPLDARARCDELEAQAVRLKPFVADTAALLRDAVAAGRRVLFEGAHSALLDLDHGTYPYVTSSSASGLAVEAACGVRVADLGVWGVVKAYGSRVGAGPFPTELDGPEGDALRVRGNEYGTTTRRPRRCGWLDLVLVRHAARTCGVDGICLTGLGVLAGLETLRVCTAYRLDGRRVDAPPADAVALEACEPIYEELQGFEEPVDGVRRYEDLPEAARRTVDLVERHAGPVCRVCVGPAREQMFERLS